LDFCDLMRQLQSHISSSGDTNVTRYGWIIAWCGAFSTALAWALCKPAVVQTEDKLTSVSAVTTIGQLKSAVVRLRPFQVSLDKPRPGDWLAEHTEDGQTFEQFLVRRPAPAPQELTTLYIQPIGNFGKTQQRLIATTSRCLGLFYGRPVKLLPTIGLQAIPLEARRINDMTQEPQILSTYVLNTVLKPKRPKDALAVLALSAEDLWPGRGWNYVFGQASLSERVGVWSIKRFGDPDASPAAFELCQARTLGTALHETGHMLGISHCTAWRCGMNGSNSLEEGDRSPLHFCAECQPKVWWSCNVEPQKHLAALIEFSSERKLAASTQYWQRALKALQAP
jgi:archaemetzincin